MQLLNEFVERVIMGAYSIERNGRTDRYLVCNPYPGDFRDGKITQFGLTYIAIRAGRNVFNKVTGKKFPQVAEVKCVLKPGFKYEVATEIKDIRVIDQP